MLWALTVVSASPAILLALAAVAGLLAGCLRAAGAARRQGVPAATAVALRSRARRSVFLRLRDPDATGRPRPRAPSRAISVAV